MQIMVYLFLSLKLLATLFKIMLPPIVTNNDEFVRVQIIFEFVPG